MPHAFGPPHVHDSPQLHVASPVHGHVSLLGRGAPELSHLLPHVVQPAEHAHTADPLQAHTMMYVYVLGGDIKGDHGKSLGDARAL